MKFDNVAKPGVKSAPKTKLSNLVLDLEIRLHTSEVLLLVAKTATRKRSQWWKKELQRWNIIFVWRFFDSLRKRWQSTAEDK